MATAVVDVGTGSSLTFGTSTTYVPKWESLKFTGEDMKVIPTSHLGTTGSETAMLGDLKGLCKIEGQCQYNPSLTIPTGVVETVTWTGPIPSGGTNGATIAGSASVVGHGFDSSLEAKMMCDVSIQFLGAVSRVVAS